MAIGAWIRGAVCAIGVAIAAAPACWAAGGPVAYPTKTIHIIVPFTAGGSSDLQARMLAEHLGRLYKQNVIVENRPGAGGHIGGRMTAEAPPDGYTMMLGSIGLHATYGIYKKLGYDPATAFKIVTVLAEMPHVAVVNPRLGVKDLKELAAYAMSHQGQVNFGSAGVGSSVHMMGELFKRVSGAPLTHVPYKGSSAAMSDLLGGQIEAMFENPPTTLGYVKSGKLRALAVTSRTRLAALPDVPTAAEAGFSGFVATSWTTVAVGAGVPDVIVDKLNADIRAIAATADFRRSLEEQGMTPVVNTRAEAARFVESERARWERIIREGHISAE